MQNGLTDCEPVVSLKRRESLSQFDARVLMLATACGAQCLFHSLRELVVHTRHSMLLAWP